MTDLAAATEALSLDAPSSSSALSLPSSASPGPGPDGVKREDHCKSASDSAPSPPPPKISPSMPPHRVSAPPATLSTASNLNAAGPSGSLAGGASAARPPVGMGARRAGMGMNLNGQGSTMRGPVLGGGAGPTKMPPGLAAKMATRPPGAANSLRGPINSNAPVPPSLRNGAQSTTSAPPATLGGLAARRAAGGGPSIPRMGPPGALPSGAGLPGMSARRGPPGKFGGPGGMSLSSMGGMGAAPADSFSNFSKVVDATGKLNFSSKAVLHADGVDFSGEGGKSYKINMSELELEEELGKGQYGTVQRVLHKPTNVVMAMKEIHLELDQSKLNGILMELDILHRAIAPEIVDFYGAFFIESCVYYCIEYMDAGSLDKVYEGGITDEHVLARITSSMVKGLGFLKDTLQIMHRDVKPTNVLVNQKGEIKLCDFGVSGQLEKSLAKTNIGCETYMAPERITGEYANTLGTYTVSSDVWSLGLTIIELSIGKYPYPPEVFSSPLAQLQAIVHGEPPTLPETFSAEARDFVAQCLRKSPTARPTYAQLLQHPFLVADEGRDVDMAGWVATSLAKRAAKGVPLAPMTPSNPAAASNASS